MRMRRSEFFLSDHVIMSRSDRLSLTVNALLLAGLDCDGPDNPKNAITSVIFDAEKVQKDAEASAKSGAKSKANDGENRPPYSYVALIAMAIQSSPEKKMKLSQICAYIMDRFPYYKQRFPQWRNSIRHNLSLDDCFIKLPKPSGDSSGRGSYWAFDSRIEDRLNDESSLKRRRPRRRNQIRDQDRNFRREFSSSTEPDTQQYQEIYDYETLSMSQTPKLLLHLQSMTQTPPLLQPAPLHLQSMTQTPAFLLHLPLMTQMQTEHDCPLEVLQLPLVPSTSA